MVTDEKVEFLIARLDELEELYRPGDFIEVDSARGPGWGCRYCPICGEFTWEGTKTSTEEASLRHAAGVHGSDLALADIAAKRAIIAELVKAEEYCNAHLSVSVGGKLAGLRRVVDILLQPFAGRTGFREEWKA